jgi:hypothetical protein
MSAGFYKSSAVHQRLVEFLGGDDLKSATAVYLSQSDGCQFARNNLIVPAEIQRLLSRNLDIARSLADSASLLFHLDVEYVNFDSPVEVYLDPWRAFEYQEPVVRAIEKLLLEWGIRPLHLITGQGHHFVWRLDRTSPLAARIAALSPAPELLPELEARVPELLKGRIDKESQRAFGTIALLLEYVAQKVKKEAVRHSAIPVELTAVRVGPGVTGRREIVSIDISEYGDPLHSRVIRVPFTYYLKPAMTMLLDKPGLRDRISKVRAIPLHEMDVRTALEVRQDENLVRDLAQRACVRIPEQGQGIARLMEEYLASRLRRFHEYFYSAMHDPKDSWPRTYYHVGPEMFPACVRRFVDQPNDALLKPAVMQLVARCLLAQDWHPRHVAGFIRSRFEDPSHQWGIDWNDYDPAIRADFYTRLFIGEYETGLDGLLDFNCTSTLEKGLCCSPPDAGACLEPLRQKLVARQRT